MEPEPKPPGEPKPTLRDSVAKLSEEAVAKDREIADLKAHIAELEAARETAASIDAWVSALLDKPSEKRAESLYELLLRLDLSLSHLDDAHEVYVRRLGLR
jgi:hypothetical protein